jgi:hypothetical protein
MLMIPSCTFCPKCDRSLWIPLVARDLSPSEGALRSRSHREVENGCPSDYQHLTFIHIAV